MSYKRFLPEGADAYAAYVNAFGLDDAEFFTDLPPETQRAWEKIAFDIIKPWSPYILPNPHEDT